jgi:protein-disulfide isomerase
MVVGTRQLAFALLLALAAGPSPGALPDDKWVEEILVQLSEFRKTQGDLVKQVEELKAQVASLQGSAGQKGGAGVSLDLKDASYPFIGDEKAQIAIVEFSDFECPYCRKHKQTTLPALAKSYVESGQVRYYFVDYPLSFHPQAMSAAVAGVCAHQQGAFWKMHDALFGNQNSLGSELYLKLAGDLSLNREKFEACLANPKTKQKVAQHAELADQAGVQGTPAFLVGRLKNGVLTDARAISGARPATDFDKVLSKYLPGT